MKYSSSIYARALSDALKAAPADAREKIMSRFVRMVAHYGDLGHASAIVDAFARVEAARSGGRSVEVAYARAPKEELRQRVEGMFSPRDHVSVRIVPSLVAGVRVTIDGTRELDLSLTGRLTRLFQA